MKNKLLSAMLISGLGTIVYSNTFHCPFQFDDKIFIIDNSAIRSLSNLQNIWNYMPCRFITFLSLALNYHFQQLNVFGYHLFNLAVHLLTALLVWRLAFLTLSAPMFKNPPAGEAGDKISGQADLISLFAALIFVSHPLQTEAVTYIWQRTASMAAMFYLASLCLYVESRLLRPDRDNAKKFYYIGSLITAVAAMFTKETAVTLPLVILLYEYCFLINRDVSQLIIGRRPYLFFLLTIFIIPITMLLFTSAAPKEPSNISPVHYLLTQFRVMTTYIRLLFLPLNQNLDYDYPIYKNIFELPVLSSILFLMAVLYCAKRLFSRYRLISFSIFWFFLTLLPESSFLSLQDVIFEHRLYLPMAGYSIFLAGSVYYLLKHLKILRFAQDDKKFKQDDIKSKMVITLTIIVTCYSFLTYQRNSVWKNEMTLLSDIIKKSPHKERPYNNRGLVFDKQGNLTQAISDFTKAIEINPRYTNAYINRGFMHSKQGDLTEAIFDYSKAIEINPQLAEAYIDRGNVYVKSGNFKQAVSDYEKAIAINPDKSYFADTYYNLGFIYYKQGNFSQAVSNFSKALEINPADTEVYNNRAVSYYQLKEYDKAWDDVNKAKELGVPVNPQLIKALLWSQKH